ncbi:MAG: [FeFe] hydrogenase H-cluster maturation GTPase HydF [Defluviitaleaceae bacterium]|nr:[FeFe] hydrogenase H-cluster maturation GTPase HydF [Defluviitaleaceae bacterium]
MNNTPRGERLHIGIFGRRNAGKSSLLNAITGQNAAVVSDVKGTTTDPVYKTMELLPIGPVVFIDTPGIDDEGELGKLRIDKAKNILRKTDIALLVVDSEEGLGDFENEFISTFERMGVKYLTVYNKCDKCDSVESNPSDGIKVSAKTGQNINKLKELIAKTGADDEEKERLAADLLDSGDVVVLVTPIDAGAPKGRLILPQQQVIRDVLEAGAICVTVQPNELKEVFDKLKEPPKLVITDSQVFDEVSKIVPSHVGLTSFSILMARYKGVLEYAAVSAKKIDDIKDGDKVLIAEGCTHHRQCDDIGTVKIPRLLEKYTGAKPEYVFTSGGEFPDDLSAYKIIIHCGGCMQNNCEMRYRLNSAKEAGIPMTNFGVAISYMQGILPRACHQITNYKSQSTNKSLQSKAPRS